MTRNKVLLPAPVSSNHAETLAAGQVEADILERPKKRPSPTRRCALNATPTCSSRTRISSSAS